MKIKRREFLKQSALGVGAALLSTPLRAADKPVKRFDPFEPVTLGKTKLKTSRFCLGTGMRGGNRESNHTRMGREKFEALIRESNDRGTQMFDLADLYGTHSYVIPALKGIKRDKYQICTKIWFREGGIPEKERPDADVCVERFLREIGTDYIDLVLLHCVVSPKWPEELRKQMDILAKLKDQGKIRAHGVSVHALEALEACITEPWVDSVHARINPYGMSMDGPADKVAPVLKKIHDSGKGVVGMKLVGEGRLRNDPEKRDESIRYVLGLGCVDVLNVGCESIAEVDDFTQRVRKVETARS
ncbi:MAG: aldo/keto reductase [Verrucomicrobia bacterium]|nr:aldo/keto reductase [Verrucomicrobiota bacterium]